jgi:hypothetical protein
MKYKLLIALFAAVLFVYFSGLKRNQIRIHALSNIPYKGNETLFFSNVTDSFKMKFDGYENMWHYFWLYGRGIVYHLEGNSFQGKGIICALYANSRLPGSLIFNGRLDNFVFFFDVFPDSLPHFKKVTVSNGPVSWHDVFKIPTHYDTTQFNDVVKNMYWSTEFGITGFDIMGIDKPYVLTKIETEEK